MTGKGCFPAFVRAREPPRRAPGTWELGRKDLLCRNLAAARRLKGDAFDITPRQVVGEGARYARLAPLPICFDAVDVFGRSSPAFLPSPLRWLQDLSAPRRRTGV